MSTTDIILKAAEWCKSRGQFPTPENLEVILRVWKVTKQEDFWTCQDAIIRLNQQRVPSAPAGGPGRLRG